MQPAPLILSFSTATPDGSVCLLQGDRVLGSALSDPEVSHSNTLLRDIDTALGAAGVTISQVDLLAAASGPGSFTGLRIGLASLKALAVSLQRPCFAIPTLAAIAHSAGPSAATVALLPAGRGELFVQLFSVSLTGTVNELDEPRHLNPAMMLQRYLHLPKLQWAGAGAHAHVEIIRQTAISAGLGFAGADPIDEGWSLAKREVNLAISIAALALERFQAGQSGSASAVDALYVRPSDAEINLNVSH